MKNMKKTIGILLMLAMLLTGMVGAVAQADTLADSSTDTGIDIVILIDRSGTMARNDPHNIALAATKALSNICATADLQSGGVNIAVIAYGYGVINSTADMLWASDGFVDVSDPSQLRYLEQLVDRNETVVRTEDTNTGLAMEAAWNMIEKRQANCPNHKFAVVLLSDGKVDVGDSVGFKTAHEGADNLAAIAQDEIRESRDKGNSVAMSMKNAGIPLHCLCIYEDSIEELGNDMENWAMSTGGRYETTNDINEVDNIMYDIYEDINAQVSRTHFVLSGGKKGYFTVEAGIVQVNIVVKPGFTDKNICLIHNEDTDTRVTLQDSNIKQSTGVGEDFTIISLPSPKPGNYSICFTDTDDRVFDLNIFSIRDLQLSFDPIYSVANGYDVSFTLRVTKDGMDYYDDKGALPMISVTDSQGNSLLGNAVEPMTWNGDRDHSRYEFTFTTSMQGEYYVQATMEKDGLTNSSEVVSFTVTKAPVRPLDGVSLDVNFSGHAVTVYHEDGSTSKGYSPVVYSYDDLERQYFDNRDHRSIDSFTVTNADSLVVVTTDDANRTLTFEPKEGVNSTCNIELKAIYEGAESEPVPGTVTVQDTQSGVVPSAYGENARNMGLQTIYVWLTMPTAESAGVIVGNDENPTAQLDNVKVLFNEPNANDGEDMFVTVQVLEGTVVSDGVAAQITDDDMLMLSGVRAGEYVVRLTATGYDGSETSVDLAIKIMDMRWIYLAVLVLILLFILLIVIVRSKNKASFTRNATLMVRLECDGDYSEDGLVKLGRYGKKAVKLSTICSHAHVNMMSMRAALEKILILPGKKGSIQIVYTRKGSGKKTINMSAMDDRTIELDSNGDRLVELSYDTGDVQ